MGSLFSLADEDAILAARRVLLRHDSQFYGPLKSDRCGCSGCKAIRGLLAALDNVEARVAQVEAQRAS